MNAPVLKGVPKKVILGIGKSDQMSKSMQSYGCVSSFSDYWVGHFPGYFTGYDMVCIIWK